MGRVVRALLFHASLLRRRSHHARETQPQPLPRQLLHDGAVCSLSQPPLAPALDNRVSGGAGRMVLSLLLQGRAGGGGRLRGGR